MKRPFGVTAALLVLTLAAAVRLPAQSYRTFREDYEGIKARARLRLGPLRLQPVFRLSEAGYDSNVYYRADGGGEVVSDFTATFAPELRAHWLLGNSVILSATESPEYLLYAREKGLRAFSNSFSGGLRMMLLRYFSLSAEYHDASHVRRSMSELDRRIRDTATGGTAGLFFETARGTAFGVTAAVDDFRYEDVASGAPDDVYARTLDRRETSAAAEVTYRVFSRSYLFATAGWTRYAFDFAESAWRDGEAVKASGGFRFPLTGRARGRVLFGWKSFRPDSAGRRPFSGLIAATEVYLRLGRLSATVGYDRDNAFSYNESAYYYVDGRARAGLTLYVAPFLRIDGGVQYGTMTYPEPQTVWSGGVPVTVERREDVQRTWSVGPVLRIGGTVGLGLTYNLYRRTSNAPGFDVRRNFAGAFLTYEF
jgi:hypothetical protein